ncbi:Ureidoglycolate hydrolase [Methylobacterium sp. Leaf469]|uniref:ureidoglycolate lyase n=1 Tax=unclassified Methylobacterium TaxID=2615210 RepID=UPI0007004FBF|nr:MULTISPECIES: ureidoglycolate lyase [unclassified Methylobacterium]KQO55921.1 Ureidoglycolate hydrolase [Methylobacterium sp. Leaf87]KQP26634.1 Ureidoglycolate hydrolase [Methylobacterium sp. Leaf100]KQT89746.1 Ureidoglycolate hydrolase [Methylobacterium sp. Leaf469]
MSERHVVAEALTAEAFAPFGSVIDRSQAAARPMNAGKARRFHDLAEIPVAGEGARVVVGLVEAEPYPMPLAVSLVERHPLGGQAFVPLNASPFLVVVCPDEDGRPGRPRAFVTAPGQGVSYAPGTWHGVLTPFGAPQDFVVIDRGGPGVNLEEHGFDAPWTIHLPG